MGTVTMDEPPWLQGNFYAKSLRILPCETGEKWNVDVAIQGEKVYTMLQLQVYTLGNSDHIMRIMPDEEDDLALETISGATDSGGRRKDLW